MRRLRGMNYGLCMPTLRLTMTIALGLCLAWPAAARRTRKGRLLVKADVVGATIEVDGRVIGESPMRMPFVVRAGRHDVTVSRPGHQRFQATVKVRSGRDKVVRARLPAVAAVLRVRTEPSGARVLLNGRMLGLAPVDVELAPGRGLLEVLADGHSRHREPLRLELGAVTDRQIQLVPVDTAPADAVQGASDAPWYTSGWVWAATGAVVAGVVTTAIVLNADDDDPRPPPTHSLVFEPVR